MPRMPAFVSAGESVPVWAVRPGGQREAFLYADIAYLLYKLAV